MVVLRALVMALVMVVSTVMGPAQPSAAAVDDEASFDTIADLDELTSDHARLFRLYWAFFLRAPDAGGALYWIGQRDDCVGLDAIADVFADSDEFVGGYGRLDDRAFTQQIYRNVLARDGDPEGVDYWTSLLARGVLTRGGVVLNVSLSSEFAARHAYPSDGVPPRPCRQLDGASPGFDGRVGSDQVDLDSAAGGRSLATVAGLTIVAPATAIERAGFHQSSHPGALAMTPTQPAGVPSTTLASRRRGTDRRGAIDIVVEPRTAIYAPVSGTVARAGDYTLYCRYRDGYVVINPDGRPDLEVKVLHVQDVAVVAGQRVEVGDVVAANATTFPFRSQIDALTAAPSWPHVHLEVVDPSIPRERSSGSC